jgi:hypothetical protein
MTERGMPSQMQASIGKPEPSMNFGSNNDKHKSGFGKDGSQINPKDNNRNKTIDLGTSQRLDKS